MNSWGTGEAEEGGLHAEEPLRQSFAAWAAQRRKGTEESV